VVVVAVVLLEVSAGGAAGVTGDVAAAAPPLPQTYAVTATLAWSCLLVPPVRESWPTE
jgi:hypothetical protein